MERIVYADHSATTYVKEEVLEEMLPYFSDKYGNASSLYKLGSDSKNAIENARTKIAHLIGAHSDEIYFTSGGSEANNLIIRGIAYANRVKGNHIITSKIEHLAILNTCKALEQEGFDVTYLDVDSKGQISPDMVRKAIRANTTLISIMLANNEVGTIQNIFEISQIARFKGVIFHTDAVQAIGSVKVDVNTLGVDALSVSAHKFYGPKGIGAAYVKKGIAFVPHITGGHQEKGKRAGTENVPAIVGMAKAMELACNNQQEYNAKLTKLRDYAIERLTNEVSDVKVNGDISNRLPGNVNISIKGIDGKALVLMLDMKKIAVSSGSACTAGTTTISHVLNAMCIPEIWAKGTVRLTFGEENDIQEVDYIIDTIKESVEKLRNT